MSNLRREVIEPAYETATEYVSGGFNNQNAQNLSQTLQNNLQGNFLENYNPWVTQMQNVMNPVLNFLYYAMFTVLTLRTILDVIYLISPGILQSLMDGGASSQMQASPQQSQGMQQAQMNHQAGMAGGGMGMGGRGGMGYQQTPAEQQQTGNNRRSIVSKGAVNICLAGMTTKESLIKYFIDHILTVIVIGIFAAILATSSLLGFGLNIGEAFSNMIGGAF